MEKIESLLALGTANLGQPAFSRHPRTCRSHGRTPGEDAHADWTEIKISKLLFWSFHFQHVKRSKSSEMKLQTAEDGLRAL